MTGKAVQESRTEGGQAAAVASSAPVESIRPSTEEHAEEANGGGLAASAWQRTKELYRDNLGLFLVFLAQIFASIMSMTTRLLETGFETKFHALQIIFVRMIVTATIGSFYLWWKKVPDFPLGPPGIRWLLVLRGLAGTTGLFGLYYSLSFLDIADATVITFLVPTLTGFVCWVALNEPFTVREALAGVVSFIGVLFVARPSFIVSHLPFRHPDQNGTEHITGGIFDPVPATPRERSIAIVCAVVGSFSAATAYATIRVIGTRVHSLVSVNYFAVLSTVSSFLVLLIHPDLSFQVPHGTLQWMLLASIGLSGFLLQVLITEGLQRERAGRATNMIYTQLVCALIIDRVIWRTTPPLESFVGGAMITGAAIWVGLQKKVPNKVKKDRVPDEETRLLSGERD